MKTKAKIKTRAKTYQSKKNNCKIKVQGQVDRALQKFWHTWAKVHRPGSAMASLLALCGDASIRRYFRVVGQKLILTQDPLLKNDQRQLLVYRVLKSFKLKLPTIYHVAVERGILLQEDVGDASLLAVVAAAPQAWPWLKKAIDILIRLHQSDFKHCLEAAWLKERFDHRKLMQEVDLTLQYFARDLLQAPPAECQALRRCWDKLCASLIHGPWVLVHRDFHTRNLMVQGKQLVVIDYQDARWGLPQYDLASLLYDAYWQWDENNIKKALDYYWQHAPAIRRMFQANKRKFILRFYQQAAQRLFKALGTFAGQKVMRGNDRYLKYIGHTVNNLCHVLAQIPGQTKLRALIAQLYYPRS